MPPRSRRTHSEWNVQTVISAAAFLVTMPPMRSRISLAALLVKVTARMSAGGIFFSSMWAMRQVTVRVLPVPAPARIMTGPSKAATAWRWAGLRESKENEVAIGGRIQAGRLAGWRVRSWGDGRLMRGGGSTLEAHLVFAMEFRV